MTRAATVITVDPGILGGIPVFTGTRVPVANLLDYLIAGDTLGQFVEDFPSVSREQAVAASGSRLPEADRHDMEVFLEKIRQLLPVLGSELLTPVMSPPAPAGAVLRTEIKGIVARGQRTPTGFVVFKGSQAVLTPQPTASQYVPYIVVTRDALTKEGTLVKEGDHLVFARDVEFSSPSTAAAVIQGGSANGLIAWKDRRGRTLKEIEEG